MVINDEEELRRRIEEGWWISRDSAGHSAGQGVSGRRSRHVIRVIIELPELYDMMENENKAFFKAQVERERVRA